MKIEHIAIWTKDLEVMKNFYHKFFNMKYGEKYTNSDKGFSSYFLSFDKGTRIEIMHKTDIANKSESKDYCYGLTHIAISVGSKSKVNELTELIRSNGYNVIGEPRTTGDGYYESVVLDPEGNNIEITT